MVHFKAQVENVIPPVVNCWMEYHQASLNLESQSQLAVAAQVVFGTILMGHARVLEEIAMIRKESYLIQFLMDSLMLVFAYQKDKEHLKAHGKTLMDLAKAQMVLAMILLGKNWLLSQKTSPLMVFLHLVLPST